MNPINELPNTQREALRLLFFSPNYTATPANIAERSYYTDVIVFDALGLLEADGHVRQVQDEGDTVQYRPSTAMIDQMRILNSNADAQIKAALDNAKRQIDGNDEL